MRAYALMVLLMMSSFMVIPYLTTYIVANVGRPKAELPYIYLYGGAATLITLTVIGRLSDRFGKLLFFRTLALATGIPVLLLTNLPHGTGLVSILIITTLFFVFTSGRMVPGMGGAMDLVCGAKRVIVAMQHSARGKSKIVRECDLPLTSIRPVDLVVTELAVIAFPGGVATLRETAPGVTVEQVIAATDADLVVPPDVSEMPL